MDVGVVATGAAAAKGVGVARAAGVALLWVALDCRTAVTGVETTPALTAAAAVLAVPAALPTAEPRAAHPAAVPDVAVTMPVVAARWGVAAEATEGFCCLSLAATIQDGAQPALLLELRFRQ